MMAAIRSIWGENVRTDEFTVDVDGVPLTPNAVRLLIKVLRLKIQETENILHQRQMHILSLLRENSLLKKEVNWMKVTVDYKSDAQKVDIHNA
jgi:hypothetical protein